MVFLQEELLLDEERHTLSRMRHTPTPEPVVASPEATPALERPKPRPRIRQIAAAKAAAAADSKQLPSLVPPTPKAGSSSKAVASTSKSSGKAKAVAQPTEDAIDLTAEVSDDDDEEALMDAEIKRKGYPLPEISAYHVGNIVRRFCFKLSLFLC